MIYLLNYELMGCSTFNLGCSFEIRTSNNNNKSKTTNYIQGTIHYGGSPDPLSSMKIISLQDTLPIFTRSACVPMTSVMRDSEQATVIEILVLEEGL